MPRTANGMQVDWDIVANIGAPILALFVGVWVNRRFEDRPKLVAFYGHVSAFKIRPPDRPSFDLFTHSVVIRNTGRRLANNVRVSHQVLPPDVTVYPDIDYKVVELPEGGKELVFPKLISKEQITISYAYFPPTTYGNITTAVRSDEGFASVIQAIPSVPWPRWARYSVAVLTTSGAIALFYCAYSAVRRFV